MSVESDVRTWLIGGGGVSSASYTFVGPMRKSGPRFPVRAITIQEYGGLKPHGFLDGREQTYRQNDVQVRVRGEPNGYIAGKADADAAWSAMNRPNTASFSSATVAYVIVEPMQSGPVFIGENDVEQPEWTINVRVTSLIEFAGDLNRVYYGSAVTVSTASQAMALNRVEFPDRLLPYDLSVSGASGQYVWLVAESDIGSFSVNGFPGGFISTGTVSIASTTYVLNRSAQTSLGNFVVRLAR
jgi:hypothetical protein